jgi:hypothetical protein
MVAELELARNQLPPDVHQSFHDGIFYSSMRPPIAREGAVRLTSTSGFAELEFLTRIQRILGEGLFSASYK